MATAELVPVPSINLKLRSYSRFRKQNLFRNTDGRLYFGTYVKPSFPNSPKDVFHTVVEGQENRLDLIAYYYYRNSELWWVIALVNDIISVFDDVSVGDIVRVPDLNSIFDYAVGL